MLLTQYSVYPCFCSFSVLVVDLSLARADVDLSCLRAKNTLDLLLLILAQGSAENGATIAAELVQHCIGIGGAEKGVHRRITRLDHRPDLLNKFLGDTEFILPPGCVEGAPCRAQ